MATPAQDISQRGLIPFTIEEPEFDSSTYVGRFKAQLKSCNPLYAFFSNKQILEMKSMIQLQKDKEADHFKNTGQKKILMSEEEIKKLRIAQTVVSSAIHPDTGEFIPWVCRLSSFLPCNIPISFGFIIAAPTPFNTIFWQWINQTYNASMNYGNRNATSLYTTQDILQSYSVAVGSSIIVALGIRKMLSGYTKHARGAQLLVFNSISSFFACATAGYLNAYFMRRTELEKGIDVMDSKGNIVGKSKAAASKAVSQTAMSRFFLALPIFFPSAMLYLVEKKGMMPRNFYLRTCLEVLFIAFELYLAVPFAIAIYP